jgi:hypothetical protein
MHTELLLLASLLVGAVGSRRRGCHCSSDETGPVGRKPGPSRAKEEDCANRGRCRNAWLIGRTLPDEVGTPPPPSGRVLMSIAAPTFVVEAMGAVRLPGAD